MDILLQYQDFLHIPYIIFDQPALSLCSYDFK